MANNETVIMSTKLHENYASVQSTSDTKTTLSMCCVNSLSAVDCICFLLEYCTPDSPLLPPPFFSLLLCFHQQHGFPFDFGQDSHCREHLSTNAINQCKLSEKSVLKITLPKWFWLWGLIQKTLDKNISILQEYQFNLYPGT